MWGPLNPVSGLRAIRPCTGHVGCTQAPLLLGPWLSQAVRVPGAAGGHSSTRPGLRFCNYNPSEIAEQVMPAGSSKSDSVTWDVGVKGSLADTQHGGLHHRRRGRARPEPPGPPTVRPEPARPAPAGARLQGASPGRAGRCRGAAETRLPQPPRLRPAAHAHEVSTGLRGGLVAPRGELEL